MDSVAQSGPIWLGLDVHKATIAVAVLHGAEQVPGVVEQIWHDEVAVRRLIGRFADPAALRVCYEAGPTGYELARLLAGMGVSCQVVAPSLIPRAPGDRVKTDRRDCRRLARLLRAGELTPVAVPSPAEEAVRDLCRARGDLVGDLTRVKHRLGAFLLRHGRVWGGVSAWTLAHERWLAGQSFPEPAAQRTFDRYRAVLQVRQADLAGIEEDLAVFTDREPFAEPTHRLAAYRGLTRLGGLIVAAEVFDWRRFPTAEGFMSFTGLTPSEHSSGSTTRRGRITKAGNAHLRAQLIEAAWTYLNKPSLGAALRRRQDGVDPQTVARSWKTQQRLHSRLMVIAARRGNTKIAVTAVAREFAGCLWAEMTA